MNNYCTNCGKKLEKGELKCSNCNTLVVDLPCDYVYVTPEKRKRNKIILYVFIGLLTVILLVIGIQYLMFRIKLRKYEKEYIKPYITQKYGGSYKKIKYVDKTDCIVSGDCYFDPVMGCDGGACVQYKYVELGTCVSYHFTVSNGDSEKNINVSVRGEEVRVAEGLYIYDKKYKNGYPFESDYIIIDKIVSEYNIYSNENNVHDYIFIDSYYENEKLLFNVRNVLEDLNLQNISIKLYDKDYNELIELDKYVKENDVIFEIDSKELQNNMKYFKLYLNREGIFDDLNEVVDDENTIGDLNEVVDDEFVEDMYDEVLYE